jgi:hypothetical protein
MAVRSTMGPGDGDGSSTIALVVEITKKLFNKK